VTDTNFSSLSLPADQLANLERLGYKSMSPIQASALPLAMNGVDLIAQAKTGSGKTAAFAIALINNLVPGNFSTQALVLCPTRELATQVAKEIRRLASYRQNIKVVTLCGGQSIGPQIGSLEHGAHIVVGTPGRIKDHLRKKTLILGTVKALVLDEADRMLAMGFIDDIEWIIEQTPAARQTLLFSATYPDDILALSARFQRTPERVNVESVVDSGQIEQRFVCCDRAAKHSSLLALLGHYAPESAVLFCNTKVQTKELCQYLLGHDISAQALHGDLEQRDRDQILLQFRHRSCTVLVATDVAARGLDIDDLAMVVNVDLPRDSDTYVHRIGRTGRAGKSGVALSIFTDSERYKFDSIASASTQDLQWEAFDSLSLRSRSIAEPAYQTLAIAGGRKEKVRPGDILGALTGEAGIDGGAVGKIDITDFAAYVAIERQFASRALGRLLNGKIKGRKFKVRIL
jgi:ATP-independent RNA helicase DbpA